MSTTTPSPSTLLPAVSPSVGFRSNPGIRIYHRHQRMECLITFPANHKTLLRDLNFQFRRGTIMGAFHIPPCIRDKVLRTWPWSAVACLVRCPTIWTARRYRNIIITLMMICVKTVARKRILLFQRTRLILSSFTHGRERCLFSAEVRVMFRMASFGVFDGDCV